jgi:hypothetical protein
MTCGDIVLGSNKGAPNELGNPRSGDVFYLLSVFAPRTAVAISSCRPNTQIAVGLAIYAKMPADGLEQVAKHGGVYGSNTSLVAQSDSFDPCNVVIAELDPGSYWVHVEGNESLVNGTVVEAEGTFEVAVLCMDIPVVEPDWEVPCAYDYITCGDNDVFGSTVGKPNFQGNSSGDVFFLLSVFQAETVYLTTCTKYTDFPALITIYAQFPSATAKPLLDSLPVRQWGSTYDAEKGCSDINIDFKSIDLDVKGSAFWVVVDGLLLQVRRFLVCFKFHAMGEDICPVTGRIRSGEVKIRTVEVFLCLWMLSLFLIFVGGKLRAGYSVFARTDVGPDNRRNTLSYFLKMCI